MNFKEQVTSDSLPTVTSSLLARTYKNVRKKKRSMHEAAARLREALTALRERQLAGQSAE